LDITKRFIKQSIPKDNGVYENLKSIYNRLNRSVN